MNKIEQPVEKREVSLTTVWKLILDKKVFVIAVFILSAVLSFLTIKFIYNPRHLTVKSDFSYYTETDGGVLPIVSYKDGTNFLFCDVVDENSVKEASEKSGANLTDEQIRILLDKGELTVNKKTETVDGKTIQLEGKYTIYLKTTMIKDKDVACRFIKELENYPIERKETLVDGVALNVEKVQIYGDIGTATSLIISFLIGIVLSVGLAIVVWLPKRIKQVKEFTL